MEISLLTLLAGLFLLVFLTVGILLVVLCDSESWAFLIGKMMIIVFVGASLLTFLFWLRTEALPWLESITVTIGAL